MNKNKGGIVKQSGNYVEGYRSQKVLFQPNVRVFLQYSVNISTRNIMAWAELGKYLFKLKLKQWILSNMKETFRKDYDLFWSVKIDK